MATGRKSSASKGGGVHFPDEMEDDVLSESGEDTQQDKIITAVAEPDGAYMVKAGFLKIQHKYEIIFLIPHVPTLGKDTSLSPALRTTPKPRLRATRIARRPEGSQKMKPFLVLLVLIALLGTSSDNRQPLVHGWSRTDSGLVVPDPQDVNITAINNTVNMLNSLSVEAVNNGTDIKIFREGSQIIIRRYWYPSLAIEVLQSPATTASTTPSPTPTDFTTQTITILSMASTKMPATESRPAQSSTAPSSTPEVSKATSTISPTSAQETTATTSASITTTLTQNDTTAVKESPTTVPLISVPENTTTETPTINTTKNPATTTTETPTINTANETTTATETPTINTANETTTATETPTINTANETTTATEAPTINTAIETTTATKTPTINTANKTTTTTETPAINTTNVTTTTTETPAINTTNVTTTTTETPAINTTNVTTTTTETPAINTTNVTTTTTETPAINTTNVTTTATETPAINAANKTTATTPPSTTTTSATQIVYLVQILRFTLDMTFTTDLENPLSVAFQTLAKWIEGLLDEIYKKQYSSRYSHCRVNNLAKGSVKVNATLFFVDTIPSNSDIEKTLVSAWESNSTSLPLINGTFVAGQSGLSSSSPSADLFSTVTLLLTCVLLVSQTLLSM